MNLRQTRLTRRFLLALFLVFVSILLIYVGVRRLLPGLAVPVTVGWSICLIIMVIHRWRVVPPDYDAKLAELQAILNLQPLVGNAFLPFGFWAMEPGSLLHLLSTIQFNQYNTIVECGSGVSTIAIGRLLKQMGGGHLYSLEEDENWYQVMQKNLAGEGLAEFSTLIHAPLQHHPDSDAPWYDLTQASYILNAVRHIDLLLVDGPKSVAKLSRYPALPVFAPKLDVHSLIVLDDSKRVNETAVIERWKQSSAIEVEEPIPTIRGQAYIRMKDPL